MSVVARVLEVAATVWVYDVVVLAACLGLGLVVQRFVPERPDDSPGLLHRCGEAAVTPLIAIAVAPLMAVIALVLGVQALERRDERRRPAAESEADSESDARASELGDSGPPAPQHRDLP